MDTLHHEIRIDAPVDAVWRAIADLAAVDKFNPLVASARYISQQREGVGAARHCELKPKGWVEERIWEWTPRRALGLEVSASEYPMVFMRWKTELAPDGSVTRVTQDITYKVKLGVRDRIVDKAAEPGTTSRAIAVHARTLEFYRQIGLADDVVRRGLEFSAANLWVAGKPKGRVVFGDIGRGISPFPYMLAFGQDEHERLLIDRLAKLGVTVERSTELVLVRNRNGGVHAVLKKE